MCLTRARKARRWTPTTPTVAWLGAALLLLVAAWLLAPPTAGPPLYDGIGFPDEPYRYVQQSANDPRTQPPTTATSVADRGPKGFSPVLAASDEQAPQIKIGMQADTLVAPAACTRVTVEAQPVAPPQSAGDTWGNGYKVSLSCTAGAGGPVQVTPATAQGDTSFIQLRAPDASQPGPTLAYSADATTWRKLATERVGNDIYQAPMVGAGLYVLLHAPGSGGLFGLDPTVLLVIGVLAALILAILAIRLGRGRPVRPANPPDPASPPGAADTMEADAGWEGWTGDNDQSEVWAGSGHRQKGNPEREGFDQPPG